MTDKTRSHRTSLLVKASARYWNPSLPMLLWQIFSVVRLCEWSRSFWWAVDLEERFAHSIDLQGISQICDSFVFDLVHLKVQCCESLRRKRTGVSRNFWRRGWILVLDWSSVRHWCTGFLHRQYRYLKDSATRVSVNSRIAKELVDRKRSRRTLLIFRASPRYWTPILLISAQFSSNSVSVYR